MDHRLSRGAAVPVPAPSLFDPQDDRAWRVLPMRVSILTILLCAGCACPGPGHRGITPDDCALVSEAKCRQECSELTTSGDESKPGPASQPWQQFAGFEQGHYCACFDTARNSLSGSGINSVGYDQEVQNAWQRARVDELTRQQREAEDGH